MVSTSTSSPDAISLDARLCLAVHQASRAMDAVYRPLLEPSGLTYPQFLVLTLLSQDGPQGVGEVAMRLSLDPSTVSPLLRRLEARGLVERRRDEADQRKVTVALTPAGSELRAELGDVTSTVCSATDLSEAEQDEFVRRLHELSESLASWVATEQAG